MCFSILELNAQFATLFQRVHVFPMLGWSAPTLKFGEMQWGELLEVITRNTPEDARTPEHPNQSVERPPEESAGDPRFQVRVLQKMLYGLPNTPSSALFTTRTPEPFRRTPVRRVSG